MSAESINSPEPTAKNKACKVLTPDNLKAKTVLKALRGLSQSHAFPKHWADQVYSAIGFKTAQVTDATGPMMHIFNVFDPISRMFSRSSERFSRKNFDKELDGYENSLNKQESVILEESELRLVGLGMSKKLVTQIVIAAKASGEAIAAVLKQAL